MATGKAIRTKMIGIAFVFGLVRLLPAANTTFTGTGLWTDGTKWNNGVPQAGDTAIIDNNGSVTLDGITVNAWSISPKNNTSIIVNNSDVTLTAKVSGDNAMSCLSLADSANCHVTMKVTDSNITQQESYIGNTAGGSVSYSQTGGTFTSKYLWDVNGASPVDMSFDGVETYFLGWRLVVGRSANTCRVSFANGTFTNCTDVLMGISDYAGGHIAFNNEDIKVGGNKIWRCGYSNRRAEKPALVTLEGSQLFQRSNAQIYVGVSGETNKAAKGMLVATDCAWTNASGKAVYVGGNASGSSGHVILSNCVYRTEGTTQNGLSFILGQSSGTTGRLDIVRGTFDTDAAGGIDTSKVGIGAVSGAVGILAIHGCNFTSFPGCRVADNSSDATIELVDGTCNVNAASIIGKKNGHFRLHVLGGSFSLASGNNLVVGTNYPNDGGTGEGELVADGSTITCTVLAAGRNSNHPGHVLLRNGAVVNCSNRLGVGYEGTSVGSFTNLGSIVKTPQIYIGNSAADAAGATGYYKDGEGSSTVTTDFRAPHCGTAYAEIGGTLRGNRFFVGIADNFTGTVTVVDGAFVDITNNFHVGVRSLSGTATLELKGGIVQAPFVQYYTPSSTLSQNQTASVYFNGGTLRARQNQASNWIASNFTATSVSDGGAVFDSNGYSVSSAAPLTHDARAGAAAKDGGVTKKGEGTVTLTGALSFNGDVRVEAGTLDLSSATFSMGPSAGLSGSGTLKVPAGGLTVGGAVRLDAARGTLTVVGNVTFGATATVEVEDVESLSQDRSYPLLTASSITGLPALSPDLPRGWNVFCLGNELRLGYASGTTIIFR